MRWSGGRGTGRALRDGDERLHARLRPRGTPVLPVHPAPRRPGGPRPAPSTGSRSRGARWCCSTSTARTTTRTCGRSRTRSARNGSSTGRSGEFDLIPQGGGDPRTGHRCPGEQITIALLGHAGSAAGKAELLPAAAEHDDRPEPDPGQAPERHPDRRALTGPVDLRGRGRRRCPGRSSAGRTRPSRRRNDAQSRRRGGDQPISATAGSRGNVIVCTSAMLRSVSDQSGASTPSSDSSPTPGSRSAGSQSYARSTSTSAGPVEPERAGRRRTSCPGTMRSAGDMITLLPLAAARAVPSSAASIRQNCGTAESGRSTAAISCQPTARLPYLATSGSTRVMNVR